MNTDKALDKYEAELSAAEKRIAELVTERDSIARLGKAVEVENRELKRRAAKEAQETIAMEHELREQIGEFEVSRDELKTSRNQLKARIAELEAENNLLKRDNDNLNSALGKCDLAGYNRLVDKLIECRAMNAALVSQSASGAGVQMEYTTDLHTDNMIGDFNTKSNEGWEFVQHVPRIEVNGVEYHPYTIWQRPVRSEISE
jgi:regulator of replication initiation timing